MLLVNHGLHIEVVIDREHPIGRTDRPAIADVVLEAALTTIVDCEDSVAAVDAEDKVAAYRNWLGLMKGELAAELRQGRHDRSNAALNPDRDYTRRTAGRCTLPGRSLMFVRNVGHLMTTAAVLDRDGARGARGHPRRAWSRALIALHDLNGRRALPQQPRGLDLHRQAEDARARGGRVRQRAVRRRVEDLLGLARHTIKIGVMDEERRTTVNLAACIHAVKDRIVFINTGFLDRTGDEIHTSMEAGPMIRKGEMKGAAWIQAYEDRNVDIGLACGLSGRAQIGKGMWAAPDRMADDAAAEDRPPAGRRQHRLGALADRRDAARHPLSPGRRRGAPGRSSQGSARAPRSTTC